jgi:hypothetical protein
VSELSGMVIDGWLAGAQTHEQRPRVCFDPLTLAGIAQLMPGGAD